jgi:hypothetical protein
MIQSSVSHQEAARIDVQRTLDAARSRAARNKLGQFATPPILAEQLLEATKRYLQPTASVSFLDPALGTGAFYSAALSTFGPSRLRRAIGFEIDNSFQEAATTLWRQHGLDVRHEDFLLADPPSDNRRADVLVCNPPYVRHHHVGATLKQDYRARALAHSGVRLSGLAGLYTYFMVAAERWLAPSGVAAWLVPSEFMDVNYGSAVKEYLSDRYTILRIHRFAPDDVQFADALVSSVVVWLKNVRPRRGHEVHLTTGGTLTSPTQSSTRSQRQFTRSARWTQLFSSSTEQPAAILTLGDLFSIKRGLATGANNFFLLDTDRVNELQLPSSALTPVLPPPRRLEADEVFADKRGHPILPAPTFLLDVRAPLADLAREAPSVAEYLRGGASPFAARYLCQSRRPWYAQEVRSPAPLLCTYMGRSTDGGKLPFRFIRNHSCATATNVYLLLYPKPPVQRALRDDPELIDRIWNGLRTLTLSDFTRQSRVYGGGLHKLEPRELAALDIGRIASLGDLPRLLRDSKQEELFLAAL